MLRRFAPYSVLLSLACSMEVPPPITCEVDSCADRSMICVALDGGIRCDCPAGSEEAFGECITAMGCGTSTCSERGTCDDSSGAAICTCDPGYAGPSCNS